MIGRSIGRFRITGPLGQGGMASVWRAHDELLGRELALKILSESLAQSDDSRRRFRHEAHIAAGLDHPGIAAVYDSGETDGLTWIAMALIEGETLADRLRKSLLPIPEALAIGIAVADALGFAHERGVVHRDVTARNVMLGRDGRIFVLDFGLALAQGTSRISSSGTTVGTAPYMAPELLTGATATPSSDLYGLGVVLYEALTGSVPFTDRRGAAAMFAVLNLAPPPIRELRPEVSAALERITLRCIEKDPDRRFESARELLEELRALDLDSPQRPGPPTQSRMASSILERLELGQGVVYLAITPFADELAGDSGPADLTRISAALTSAAAAGASRHPRVHVIRTPRRPELDSPGSWRDLARELGANLLLVGTVRSSGSRLRAEFALLDPDAGLQISSDTIDGPAHDPFELEDRLVESLSRILSAKTGEPVHLERERPRDPAAEEHYQQALRYLERHDHEASVDGGLALLERLVESNPEDARFHAMFGRACLMKLERTTQRLWQFRGASAIERAAQIDASAAETLLALGDLHRTSGRFDEAAREYAGALARRPDYYEARLGRALALHLLGHPDEVERACAQAISHRPDDWRGYNLLGWSRTARGHHAAALAPLRHALTLAPDNALVSRNLGIALFHLDRFEEASAEIRKALAREPSASGHSNLGTALFFAGDFVGAADAMEKSVALNPADPVRWGNLGSTCRFLPERGARAVEALRRAIGLMQEHLQRNPNDAESWAAMAGWFANLEREREAEQAVERALSLAPSSARCLSHAVHVYWQLGKRDSAFRWLAEALRLGHGAAGYRRSPELATLVHDPEFDRLLSEFPETTGGPTPGPNGREETE